MIHEAGLTMYHANARMYDPKIGRFNQIDPKSEHPALVGLSPYNYALNNPVYYNDPSGECPPIICGAVIGGVVGGLVGAGIAIYQGKDARGVLKSAASGAVGGAIIGSGAGLITSVGLTGTSAIATTVGFGASAGAASSIVDQGFDGNSIDGMEVITDATIGGVSNIFAAGAGSGLQKFAEGIYSQALVTRSAALSKDGIKAFSKSIKKELRALGFSRSDVNAGVKQALEALKSTTQTDVDVANILRITISVSGQVSIETAVQSANNELDEVYEEQ